MPAVGDFPPVSTVKAICFEIATMFAKLLAQRFVPMQFLD